MQPDLRPKPDAIVIAFLARVARRLQLVDAMRATLIAVLVTSSLAVAIAAAGYRPASLSVVFGLVALAAVMTTLWRASAHWSPAAIATLAERRIPESHNIIFTAHELLERPGGSAPWIERRVVDRAASLVGQASLPAIVPVERDVLWLAVAATTLAVVAFLVPLRPTTTTVREGQGDRTTTGAAALRVIATVTPPSYTNLPQRTLSDPISLEVIRGSHIRLALAGEGEWTVRYGPRRLSPTSAGVEIEPPESGYFAIERRGEEGSRRLMPVTVTPDRAPSVRIESPGKDLLMPATRGSISIAATATDDLGLQALDVRYTTVRGSGEQFQFVEGVLPLAVVRESSRGWKASGAFDLTTLGLVPGDSLVYRATARDARPSREGEGASDTFFIEIAGPDQIAVPGIDLPPDRERYALSQQMIVLKIQRLRARERSMTRTGLAEEVSAIAAEQRAVRANFIFLMGGQVEDEQAEAEHSSEIQEGRLENSARREINSAIRFMGQAEQALVAVDTGAALPPAKSAVDALQRAFGHNRYFLRTLAVRSRLDPSRRLTGDLKEASGWRRTLDPVAGAASVVRARSLLARLMSLTSAGRLTPAASTSLSTLAEEALAVDPGSSDWRRISAALGALRDAVIAGRDAGDIRGLLNDAVTPLAAISRKDGVRVDARPEFSDALREAWMDEARRR